MEESVFSQSPFSTETTSSSSSSSSSSRRGKKLLFLIILLIILGLIAFGAVKFLGDDTMNSEPTPTPTQIMEPTPTDLPTPTPEEDTTPTPTGKVTPTTAATPTKTTGNTTTKDTATGIDRATITVAVQNGSGVTGAAKKAGDELTDLGYTLGTVGNADTSDYAQSEIHVKAGKSSLLTLLKKDLGATYTVGTAAADYTGSGDALVIIGKE